MSSNLDSNNYSESELSLLHEQADNNISQETSIMPPKLPTTRRGRRLRKEQREGFDYQAYIDRELEKMQPEMLSEEDKRQAIVRIRNRMSAQRSRTRQRERLSVLSDYSKKLHQHAKELERKNLELTVALEQRSLAPVPPPPALYQLEFQSQMLMDSLNMKIQSENALLQRVAELEKENLQLRRAQQLEQPRAERALGGGLSVNKTFLLFFGLTMLSLIILRSTGSPNPKSMEMSLSDRAYGAMVAPNLVQVETEQGQSSLQKI